MDVRVDGWPASVELEQSLTESRAYWTSSTYDLEGAGRVTRRLGSLHRGARVTVDGRLIHIEGAAWGLRV